MGKSRKRSRVFLQGLSKSPRTMLVLLALPLLAVSAQGQVEDRNHLLEDIIEDLENHQYPDYQYSDQMYDPEPAAPARALHQDDLRGNSTGKTDKELDASGILRSSKPLPA